MTVPLWLYGFVVTALCVALAIVADQRNRARSALTDHLAGCTDRHCPCCPDWQPHEDAR